MNSRERRVLKRALAQLGMNTSELADRKSVPQEQPTPPPRKLSILLRRAISLHGWLWKVVLGVATLAGIGFWQLWPRVAVEPYATLDGSTPFSQQFSVQNNSVYSLRDVQPLCLLKNVTGMSKRSMTNMGFRDMVISRLNETTPLLAPTAKTNATCDLNAVINPGPDTDFHELDIAIVVTYELPFPSHIKRCWQSDFLGQYAIAGQYVWTYRGAKSCEESRN